MTYEFDDVVNDDFSSFELIFHIYDALFFS